MKYFKKARNGDSRLATVGLENKSGKVVTLIGVTHVAEKDFYTGINDFLELHRERGGEVQMEYVSSENYKVPKGFIKLSKAQYALAEMLDLEYQGSHIDRSLPHVNSDMHISEVLQRMPDPKKFLEKQTRVGNTDFQQYKDDKQVVRFVNWIIRNVGYVNLIPDWMLFGNMRVILHDRNDVAVAYIEGSLNDNIAAVWGVGHLEGIIRRLKARGYKVKNVSYHTNVRKITKQH